MPGSTPLADIYLTTNLMPPSQALRLSHPTLRKFLAVSPIQRAGVSSSLLELLVHMVYFTLKPLVCCPASNISPEILVTLVIAYLLLLTTSLSAWLQQGALFIAGACADLASDFLPSTCVWLPSLYKVDTQ